MGKIKGWKKNIDSKNKSQWINKKRGHVVTIRKFQLWEFRIYGDKGQHQNKQLNKNNLSKKDALFFAMKYMRKYP
jgi:hypothetical protein